MAVWFSLKDRTCQDSSVQLHINLWRMGHRGKKATKTQPPDLFDIGILVAAPANLSSISFYVPTLLGPTDILDLGPEFRNSDLATGIFNESLTATNGSTSVVLLRTATGQPFSGVYKFPTSNKLISEAYLDIKNEFDGTILTIKPSALEAGVSGISIEDSLYFRLRIVIPRDSADTFINAAIPNDNLLTSGVDVIEYLDFRLNQARNLNPGILNHMTSAGSPTAVPITRLDFLLVVAVIVDVIVGHPAFHKCRLLETELWKSYVDEAHLRKGMVIYHWREIAHPKSYLFDFNAFVKLRLRLSNRQVIRRYLLIAFIFSIASGLVGNLLYDTLKLVVARFVGGATSNVARTSQPEGRDVEPSLSGKKKIWLSPEPQSPLPNQKEEQIFK